MIRPRVVVALTVALAALVAACQRSPDTTAVATATLSSVPPALLTSAAAAVTPSTVATAAATLAPSGAAVGTPRAARPTVAPLMAALDTDVQLVRVLGTVNLRGGPGTTYPRLGQVFAGQIVKVTGVSEDKQWWRILCLDGTTGNCWLSAAPTLTQPVQP